MSPLRSKLSFAIDRGWRTSPTVRSVVDKQASAMLDLVRSCGLVFTATITRMLSKIMKGQVTAFTTILTMNTARTSGEMFARFGRWMQKVELEKVVLMVVWFITARSWLVNAFSLCVVEMGFLRFALCLLVSLMIRVKVELLLIVSFRLVKKNNNSTLITCSHFNKLICIISLANYSWPIFNRQYT